MVKKNENLTAIARRLQTTPQEIIKINKGLYNYKAGAVIKYQQKETQLGGKPRAKWKGKGGTGRFGAEPAVPTEQEMLEGILGWEEAKEAYPGATTEVMAGGKRRTTWQGRGGVGRFGAPPPTVNPLKEPTVYIPGIAAPMTEAQANYLYTQSTKYTADAYRYALSAEGLSDEQRFELFPNLISDRQMRDLGFTTADMEAMGYQKVGNWWKKRPLIDLMSMGDVAEAAGTPSLGAGEGGGGGGGRGGGGVASRVRAATRASSAGGGYRPNLQYGNFMRSITGRMYTPEFGGMIHWRL